jgi:tRNA pseudouridine13 synthase
VVTLIEADEVDKSLGMYYYIYEELYVGDILEFEKNPKNFKVYEIYLDGTEVSLELCSSKQPKTQGRFAYFIMCKEGIDTFYATHLLKQLFKTEVGYAGLKDCESYSCQLISVDTKYLRGFENHYRFNNITLCLYKYSDHPLMRGHLLGNTFKVFSRYRRYDVDVVERINNIEICLRSKYLANYYGYQRFGTIRPTTHLIGKAIINRDWYETVRVIAGTPIYPESNVVRIAREEFELGNYYKAFNLFPPEYWIERRVCKVMNTSKDPFKALKSLPKEILYFYVEAYQSYIFNKILSEALKYFKDVETLRNTCETLIVPGSNIILHDDICSSITHEVIEHEGVKLKDFIIKELGIVGKGYVRDSVFRVGGLNLKYGEDGVWFNFRLQRGSYASILLRELFRKV